MSGLIGLLVILVGVLILILASIPMPTKPEEKRSTFTVPLKAGQLTADVVYFGESVDVERAIRRWAIRLTDPKQPLDDQLEAATGCKVVGVTLSLPEPEEVEMPEPSESQRHVARVTSKIETAKALLALRPDMELDRPLDDQVEGHIKHTVTDLFNHPDHV